MNGSFSSLLNFFRWIAALLVIASHCRHLILVDFKNVEHSNYLIKAIYFITGFGDEAVIIFFVISGFLVGGLTIRKWSTNVSYKDYFAARFSRIYSTLLPALIVGAGLDWIGLSFFNKSKIYTDSSLYHTSSMDVVISNQLSPDIFLGNILNLEGIIVPIFGSNSPLWSLAFEWWYYTMFAAFLGSIFDSNKFNKIICLLIIIILAILLPTKLILWMVIWLFGVGVYLYGESSLPKPHYLIAIILFITTLISSRLSHNTENVLPVSMLDDFLRDFGFGMAFSFLLLGCYNRTFILPYEKSHKSLADFSYSVYLFHFPIFILLMALSHDIFNINFIDIFSNI